MKPYQANTNPVQLLDRPAFSPSRKGGGSVSMVDPNIEFERYSTAVCNKLMYLVTLPYNWDTYEGVAPTAQTAIYAQNVILSAWRYGLHAPDITPLSDGTIMAEWFSGDRELTVEIERPYHAFFMATLAEESEGTAGKDLSRFKELTNDLLLQPLAEEQV